MTGTIQIQSDKSLSQPATSSAQPSAASGAASGQDFNVLLELLASLLTNNGTSAPSALQQAVDKSASSAGSSAQYASVQSSAPGGTFPASADQQSPAISSGASQPAKQGQSSQIQSTITAAYMAAGIPFVIPFQNSAVTQNQPSHISGSQATQPDSVSGMPSNPGEAISALLAAIQPLSGSNGTYTGPVSDSGQSRAVGAGNSTTAQQTSDPTETAVVNADLLKLLSAASGGTTQTTTQQELSGLIEKLNTVSVGSVQDLVQKLKDSMQAGLSKQVMPPPQPGSPAVTVDTAPQPASTLTQDLNSAIASSIKSSSQNSSGKVAQVVAASAENGVPNAAVATSTLIPGQSAPSGSSTSSTGTQNSNQQGAATTNQVSQVQAFQPSQDSQGSSDSGKDLPDMLRMGAVQFAANGTDASKGNVAFGQALSTATQNLTPSNSMPSVNELAQSIVKEVNMMTREGKTIVNMKLEPDSLGSVTLQVVSEGGKISAQFDVKTPDARAYLESSVPQMKQMLETNGVSLSHLTVSLSSGESQSKNPRFQHQPGRQRAKYYGSQTATASAAGSNGLSRSFGYNTMEMQL